MERYTSEERGVIANDYLTKFRSVVLTQREFRRRFPRRPAPCARTIKRLAERLVQTGSTTDVARSGRPRIARSTDKITAVAEDVRESPHTSTRQRCTKFGISRRSLRRILMKDLKMGRKRKSKSTPSASVGLLEFKKSKSKSAKSKSAPKSGSKAKKKNEPEDDEDEESEMEDD